MSQQPPSYTFPETIAALSSAFSENDYKALICVFFYGGKDSHNMVVPYGQNPNRLPYENVRAFSTRVEQSELASSILSGTSSQWALHPQLPFFLSQWNAGDLAIVRDVGTLNKPTTKQQFLSDPTFTPTSLFAHNIQQAAWQAGLPFGEFRTTGWFGRTANLIDSIANNESTIDSSSISVSGSILQGFPYSPKKLISYPATVINYGYTDLDFFTNTQLVTHRAQSSSPLKKLPSKVNLIYSAFGDYISSSIDSQASLKTNGEGWISTDFGIGTQLQEIFNTANQELGATNVLVPDPEGGTIERNVGRGFLNAFENAARIVYSRGGNDLTPGLRQKRQLIFIGVSPFDHHNFLRFNQDPLLRQVDICYKALVDALKAMGVYEKVTIFTESEFSRTLRSNGTNGTDHAWSGHSFVMGGSVLGGMYGEEPDYTLGGDWDVYEDANQSIGRFIPKISTEQYYATLLKWAEIPPNLIPLILPALPRYFQTDLGFMM
jgi:uncharacterized protein (DUF1501 family)